MDSKVIIPCTSKSKPFFFAFVLLTLALIHASITSASAYTLPDGLPHSFAGKINYTLFETVPVRPLSISQNGRFLYSVNTPDDRLEIFSINNGSLSHIKSVPVGMRPVAVAVAPDNRVWVVNYLSDSVSIVDPESQSVVETLWVGDEPRDIVFAGTGSIHAYITSAHRGQNVPFDPELTTPGQGRADVWVFNAGAGVGTGRRKPSTIINLFADSPRALAVSNDSRRVYVSAFRSGNQTTVLHERATAILEEYNIFGEPQPQVGSIVQYRNGSWKDAQGNDVSEQINFTLPDYDVFTIDTTLSTPAPLNGDGNPVSGVGTTLFNMAVNPVTGALYVSNTEADNIKRFEGHGLTPNSNTTNRGNFAKSRITVIPKTGDLLGAAQPRHLNAHIDYSTCCAPPNNLMAQRSIALPRQLVVSADGTTIYAAAFGSGKIVAIDVDDLERGDHYPELGKQLLLGRKGPTGMVLDSTEDHMYIHTHFDNSITVVEMSTGTIKQQSAIFTPEPDNIRQGRPFLYDATLSSHGDSTCSGCHIEGDVDHLAWDLGDPNVESRPMPGSVIAQSGIGIVSKTTAFAMAIETCSLVPFDIIPCAPQASFSFDGQKGPMTTQTLAGLDNHGPMHWRGDRTGGTALAPGWQPNTGMFNEETAFMAFNVAFPGLIGRNAPIPEDDMRDFTRFMLENTLPPNPIRRLDNSLTALQQQGEEIFFGGPLGLRFTNTVRTCNGCHTTDLTANAEYGVRRPGFFGTDGRFAFVFSSESFKVPHLRNVYQKVGMFAMHDAALRMPYRDELIDLPNTIFPFLDPQELGPQIRGFGFTHDGSLGTVFQFMHNNGFTNSGFTGSNNVINPGGFIPYVPAGKYPATEEAYQGEFEPYAYLAATNDPFYSQMDKTTGLPPGDQERRAIEAFTLAFPSNMAPIVGQQITVGRSLNAADSVRIQLMEHRATITDPQPECDLIAHGTDATEVIGHLYDPSSHQYYGSDENIYSRSELLQRFASTTLTCVPPGNGVRSALDRDMDGHMDAVEVSRGSDPADAMSIPTMAPSPWRWWSSLWR